jgi:hypothetical protein
MGLNFGVLNMGVEVLGIWASVFIFSISSWSDGGQHP